MPNSFNWASATAAGAAVKGQLADWVLGKAITSRIELDPVINITIRSTPKAKPPCGGQPDCNASSKKPNFSQACYGSIPN
jgi:hypothetical protein